MANGSAASECVSRYVTVTVFFVLVIVIVIATPQSSRAAQASESGGQGDAQYGKRLFDKRCGGCHSLDHDQTGPRLRTVYGRKAGSISTFRYSTALRSAKITWDDVLLDKWLSDPDSLIPENEMDFSVPKSEERAAIIRFLRLSSGQQATGQLAAGKQAARE
jgi:cytochrome c